jgi:hypothetical protein
MPILIRDNYDVKIENLAKAIASISPIAVTQQTL